MKLSIVILSKTDNLEADFIDSLGFADEIVVICSTPISKNKKVSGKLHFFYHPIDDGFAKQRNYGLSVAKGDWVLFVDTDEVISTMLAKEIIISIETKDFAGFYLPRIDTCYHQVQLHGEVGNTKIIRLALRKSGKYLRAVHEYWNIKGKIGELRNPLFHTKDHFVSEFMNRITTYGDFDAISLIKEGKPFSFFRLLAYPKAKFIQNYFLRLGFLDGITGLFQAYLMAIQSLSVRVFQWTLQKSSSE